MLYRVLPIGLLLAWLVHAMSASAQAVPRLRVQLRVHDESDARLLERTRGQTSDLPVELSAYAPSAPLGSFAATVAQAFLRCRESGADVVAWGATAKSDPASKGGASWIVALATCKDSRVFARRIESMRPALGSSDAADSGVLEAAALVLRGALSVLAQGGTLGVVARGSEPEPELASEAEQATARGPASGARAVGAASSAAASASVSALPGSRAQAATGSTTDLHGTRAQAESSTAVSSEARARDGTEVPQQPAPTQRSQPAVAVLTLAGVQQAWDGASAAGQPALYGAVGLGKGNFRLGLTGSFGFELTHQDQYTKLLLSRHTVAAQWRQSLWQRPDWALSAGLDAGVIVYRRATRSLSSAAQGRPSSLSPAAFASPWFGLGRRVGPLWVSLCAGLDLLPFVPSFAYRTPAGSREALQLWPVAPRLVLAFGIGRP